MLIYEKIKEDLKEAVKKRDIEKIASLKVIIGEFQRQPKKELSDIEVIKIIKILIKYERENPKPDISYLSLLESYVPKEASKEEIEKWIKENIDFSKFKNKMQSMRPIMDYFGAKADGNIVKEILLAIDK